MGNLDNAPDGSEYRFGGLDWFDLELFRWLRVGPKPEPVKTTDQWFGLLVHSLADL